MKISPSAPILFQEINYSYRSNGKPSPLFDLLITRIFIFPLIIFCFLFVILSINELQNGNIFIPYIFQSILLFIITLSIFVYYPRRILIITHEEVILNTRRKTLQRILIKDLHRIEFHENEKELALFLAHTVTFYAKHEELTCIVHAKNTLEKIIESQFPQFHHDKR